MKNILLLLLCLVVYKQNTTAQGQKIDSIYYRLPKGIDQLIMTGIESLQKLDRAGAKHFYLLIDSGKSDSTFVLLIYADKGFDYWLSKNSNRFYKMSNETVLPIIFDTDLRYGVNAENPQPVSLNIGGYKMYIFRNKAVKGGGIVQ
jgi:hypothetical protein